MSNPNIKDIALPARPFLYTIDQIASMLSMTVQDVHVRYIYHAGRDVGFKSREMIEARNISPRDQDPEWRVTDSEFRRWLKFKGFKYYDRGLVK